MGEGAQRDDEAKRADEPDELPVCGKCQGTGLNAGRSRFCSACLGSGKEKKRPYGWQ